MSLQLADSAAVIVARNFNVSLVTQLWLVNNQVVRADEFGPGCMFTDMLVMVRSGEFDLLVTPDQLQFRPRGDHAKQQALLVERIGAFVSALPHTPYTAIGLNFTWTFIPERSDITQLSREFFFVRGSPLHQAFDVRDARFGGYLSKDMFGGRLKLDVKPALGESEGRDVDYFLLAFNFHRDSKGQTAVAEILQLLRRWTEAREHSTEIAEAIAKQDDH